MTESLDARVARLEAVEEIRVLKARYADVCDTGYDPDRMLPFFTQDAVWDGGERFGRYEGIDAIYGFFRDVSSQITWALHYMIAPVIEVSDDGTATGSWYLWQPCTVVGPRRAPGRLADGALRGPLQARGGRLEVLGGPARHPDGQSLRGRVGAQAFLALGGNGQP